MGSVLYNHASELATISTTFSVNGTPTDPTTTTFVVTDPDGNPTTYTGGQLTHGGTGVFSLDVSCTSSTPGVWTAVLVGTGTATDVDVVTWTTYDVDLSKLYITPTELKSRKGITDNLDDLEILGACMAATTGIDLHCNRVFARAAGTRTFEAKCGDELELDIVSITTLKTDEDRDGIFETTWSASDYQLLDVDAAWKPGGPWPYTKVAAVGSRRFPVRFTSGRHDLVQIEGVFEFPRVPPNVKQAGAIIASDLGKLGTMTFGVAGYGDYGAIRARENPIAAAMLQPYRRYPVLVG